MTSEADLTVIRRAFARQVMAAGGAADARLEDAFATVRREHFLGPGPWLAMRWARGYVPTPSDDPVYLYTNDLFAIRAEQQLNNGEPSLHAHLLAQAAIEPGAHVVHVGAGVGYYSALMAVMAGPGGRVTAIEFEPELAETAARNLAPFPWAQVVQGDGSAVPFDPADVIYVNAGATRPAEIWLDRLLPGGRLVVPLTTDKGFSAGDPGAISRRGAVFVITRRADNEFGARWVSGVAIYPCQGMRDAASEQALAAAFAGGDPKRVTRLLRGAVPDETKCWCRAPGWALVEN